MARIRAFIGIQCDANLLPTDWQDRIKAIAPSARMTHSDDLHITLKFLGMISVADAELIINRLEAALSQHGQFNLTIGGIGLFEPRGKPQIIWAGVHDNGPLFRLRSDLEAALEGLGLAPADNVYNPHVTLARTAPSLTAQERERLRALRLPHTSFTVSKVGLFVSDLKVPAGQAGYRAIREWRIDRTMDNRE